MLTHFPVTVTGSCPAPATVTVTRTSGSSTSVATSLTTTLLAQQVSPTGHANPGLADLAAKVRDGIYFGTAVDYPGTNAGNDPIYLDVAQDNHEFNQWTPGKLNPVLQSRSNSSTYIRLTLHNSQHHEIFCY